MKEVGGVNKKGEEKEKVEWSGERRVFHTHNFISKNVRR